MSPTATRKRRSRPRSAAAAPRRRTAKMLRRNSRTRRLLRWARRWGWRATKATARGALRMTKAEIRGAQRLPQDVGNAARWAWQYWPNVTAVCPGCGRRVGAAALADHVKCGARDRPPVAAGGPPPPPPPPRPRNPAKVAAAAPPLPAEPAAPPPPLSPAEFEARQNVVTMAAWRPQMEQMEQTVSSDRPTGLAFVDVMRNAMNEWANYAAPTHEDMFTEMSAMRALMLGFADLVRAKQHNMIHRRFHPTVVRRMEPAIEGFVLAGDAFMGTFFSATRFYEGVIELAAARHLPDANYFNQTG